MTDDEERAPESSRERWTALRTALVRAVRRQCPAWLTDHADDLVQCALVKVMAIAGAGEGTRALSSFYLHRVAHSALVDEIRRRQRRREVALEADESDGQPDGAIGRAGGGFRSRRGRLAS